jgi:ceramide glucosyltransferase
MSASHTSVFLLLALLWAGSAVLFSCVTLVRLGRPFFVPPSGEAPDVLLLRPLDEPTAQELDNFAREVAYPGNLRHVVLSPYRPRLPRDVEWLYSDPPQPNRKVGHLVYALSALARPGEVVLCVDADVAVDGALVLALAQGVLAGAALCTAAPEPFGAEGYTARAVQALLRWTHHAFVPLHCMSVGAKAVCGKALALGPEAQALLPTLGQQVGEDLELALLLHARGQKVALASAPARIPLGGRVSTRAAVQRFGRWMRVLRAHRPFLFPTVPWLLCPTPPLLLVASLAGSPWLFCVVALLLAVRTALALQLCTSPGEGPLAARDWLLAEALLFAAFTHALLFRDVAWRGRRFRLLSGGRMQQAVEEP